MRINLDEWVTRIQEKPEHIRMRYVVGCVVFAMLLVLGVWSLSVSESFRAISSDAGAAATGSKSLLPSASKFSLDALLSGEKSLEERKKEVSGELFFQQQLDKKEAPNFEENGYVPAPAETQNQSDQSAPTDTLSR